MTDYKLNSIYRDLKLNRIKTSASELKAIINSDFVPIFNPFKSYFEDLPKWDGQTDYIAQLAATVSTTNDQLWEKCLRKWLVAMVGSAIQEEIVNHTVVVFSGPQGIGKSTWILNLVPTELKNYVFSGTINPSSKDTLVQISECLLINMDELETMSKAQIGELKEMCTKAAVRIRRAYGFHVENMPRRASFSGSVNDKEFLNDATGSRRFLSFEVTNIQYHHGIRMDHVFSQAYTLFHSGFQFWFDGTEIQEIAINNEQFQSVPFEEELLLTHYEPVAKEEASLFLSTTDIASNLAEHRKFNITASTKLNLGRALHKHKFVRVKKKGRYVFAVKPKHLNLSVQLAAAAQEPNN
jgi:predicted P-loop ATPase